MMRRRRCSFLAWGLVVAAAAWWPPAAGAQTVVKMISHRYPALEYYAKAIGEAPGVKLEATLVPQDKCREISIVTLSSGSSAYDIIWANDSLVLDYASKGWLEPLDDFLAKYRAQYQFQDFPEQVMKNVSYNGKVYGLPFVANAMFFFYRKDVFDEKGLKPPATFADYAALAKSLTTKDTFGTTISLKRVDAALNEFHWYLNAHGAKWFDAKWKPTFNGPDGVKALETLKAVAASAPPGVTSYANDESTVALQQGLALMGLQWFSRAATMDNPAASKVVGKVAWANPPSVRAGVMAGQRITTDVYAISKFSKADKDLVFRALAHGSSRESMRGGAKLALPTRAPLLNDPELVKQNRHWPAALEAMKVAVPYPQLPEFVEIGEGVTLKVHQALAGELTPKQALDQAAADAEALLKSRGYYK